jgi:hypothetical protein
MEKRVNSLSASLSLPKWGVTSAYSASRMLGYEYRVGPTPAETNWFQRQGNEHMILRNKDFSLAFAKNFSMKELWKKRLDFSINTNTSLRIDLQRYTSSIFSFSLGFTLGINKFISLSVNADSTNARIYQYFHDWPGFRDAPIKLPANTQTNLFLDLFNSFRFDNEDLRRRSAFKMKSFRISAVHYLGDWNAILNWSMEPYRPPGGTQYEINNEVSFLLQWIPVSEIKSDIKFDKNKSPKWEVKGL